MKYTTKASANVLLDFLKTAYIVKLVGLDSSEIIAKEFQYRRTFYKENTQTIKSNREKRNYIREERFDALKIFVKEHIIDSGEIIKHSQLVDYYEEQQKQRNLEVKGANNCKIAEYVWEWGNIF